MPSCYGKRLAETGFESSVGRVGDSDHKALVEKINGLLKAEVVHRRGLWRSFAAGEYATLERVEWFCKHRLRKPIGDMPRAKAGRSAETTRFTAIAGRGRQAVFVQPGRNGAGQRAVGGGHRVAG